MTRPHLQKQILLRPKEDRRVLAGHPWIFSNELRESRGNPQPGDIVEVLAASGLTLGVGLYNPHSLIACRLLSRTIEEIDAAFFRRRISEALELRRMLYPGSTVYRLVHGEGDFLSGLIIDRYNEYLSVQTFSYGMDTRLPLICDALESLFQPAGIVERNESPLRALEKLPQKKGMLRGTGGCPTIVEHGLQYTVDLLEGQKTGFFLDQRENRRAIASFSKDAAVLDCFCYEGGFALNAARGGASSVLAIDSSAEAVRRAGANASLNGLRSISAKQADVFTTLHELQAAGKTFDVVVLDPPSFTRSKKNVSTAKKGYRELHDVGLRVLRKGGILMTASCSHHIEPEVFLEIINDSAQRADRPLQLLDWRGAAPDHPSLPSVPESRYLKFGMFRID